MAIEAIAHASATVAVSLVVHNSLVDGAARARRPRQAERSLAAAPRLRRRDRRVCVVGAGSRYRRCESEDTGDEDSRRVSRHGPESLGRKRRRRGRGDRLRVHATRAARSGRDGVSRAHGHARHHTHGAGGFARCPRPRLHGSGLRRRGIRRPGPRLRRSGVSRRDVGAPGRPRRHCGAGARDRGSGDRRSISRLRKRATHSVSRLPISRRSSGCWPTSPPTSKPRAC